MTEDAHAENGHDGLPPQTAVKRWLVTTNHKDVGILYIVTSLFFLVFGGVLALLMRVELWTATQTVIAPGAYNETVSAHGLIMIFFFISPFAFGFANYVVPLQIGAEDLSFPRLNALSYWLYLFSGLLFGTSFFLGGTFSGGWTMYAPLNMPAYTPTVGGTTAVLALMLFVASVTVSSVNFLTTMHRQRAEGLTTLKLPLFSWTILLTVWMMLFAFAALLAALLILASDRIVGTVYFQATEGGSLLWAHLFWFFGHPEVYIVFFPALGIMAECFQTFCGRRIVGRKWFIAAMVLVAIQSFFVWMHHMFLTAISLEIKTLFMATTIGISLPFDLMVFALIYTMVKGKIRYTTPFLFSFGALVLFIIGGITGVFLGAVVLDYEFRGTYWVVAHFHYVMVGGATALFGGLYYWYPKITGRMYDEFLGKVHFVLYFVGFNLLYFPMFVAWETPRRVFEYHQSFVAWHQLASIGGFVLAAGFLVMFYNLYKSLFAGEEVDGNPWEYASSAEWSVSSPPPFENFPGLPSYGDGRLRFLTPGRGGEVADGGTAPGDDALDAAADPATESDPPKSDGGTVTAETARPEIARDETADTALPDAEAEEEHPDHASYWPLAIGLSAYVTFLGLSGIRMDTAMYPALTGVGLVMGAFSFVGLGRESFHVPEMAVAERWPFEGVENGKLGMWIFLASDVVLFGSLIGSYVFIRVAYGWTAWHVVPHDPIPGLINTYLLLTSSFTVVLALVAAKRESTRGLVASLGATVAFGVGFLYNKGIEWQELFHEGTTVGSSVEASTFFLTTGLHAAHVIIGLLIALFMIAQALKGAYLGEEGSRKVEYFGLYWHFVDIVWLFLFPLFYIL
ncbi:cbb3-type cytochrome c oxidase subunit I [Halostella pelagica]|uniref:cbb3-type cytochrome c oxidase subunit I n=1 Tax=Halostella pelagica TaxID=2583824 RepID=UPI00108132CA|nr:cbb3-type cytochrome c oxidase subunit I [Halostella pelagica]